ncbi:MAG: hypothetical protein MK295_03905, partial [Pseudomonadales bacterium]|nr:hypothetical protein [Pseudomonadales bacterium]
DGNDGSIYPRFLNIEAQVRELKQYPKACTGLAAASIGIGSVQIVIPPTYRSGRQTVVMKRDSMRIT